MSAPRTRRCAAIASRAQEVICLACNPYPGLSPGLASRSLVRLRLQPGRFFLLLL